MGSNDGTLDEKFEFLFLSDSLEYIDGLEFDCTEGTELWIFNGRVIGKTIVHMMVQR